MLKYLQINDKDNLPELIDFNPFTAVVLVEEEVTVDWQAKVSEWLVASGCLYMMAWGKECSSWDDSVDWANIEKFDFSDIPDEFFVMTTWHENESVEEVFWFAKNCTYHDYIDSEDHNALILHISSENKEKELVDLYENARCLLKAKFKMDDAYYKESLGQWIKYISKGRKYEPLLSVGLIVSGLFTLNFLPPLKIAAILAIGIGIFEGIKHLVWRHKCLKDRKSDKSYNQEIEMLFNSDSMTITQISPKPVDEELKPILRVIQAAKGEFYYLEEKVHVYIPHSSFDN